MAELHLTGRKVIPALAEIYQQLYLTPGEEGQEQYRDVVLRGLPPPEKRLDHFRTSGEDSCCMEHTPAGGRIEVSVSETPLFTEFIVRDTGEGFVPEDIPHLFERFYKGQNASEGSIGIGLALSRMIISAQNGTITADNAPEGGARFTVRFYKTVI